MPAVVRLLAVHRAPVAVKTLIRIGIDAGVVDDGHAGVFEPYPYKAGEIEHRVALARRGKEEQRVLRIGLDEALDELSPDFVGVLADQGTDRSDDAAWLRAEFFHGPD